jgi:hypothetical protein
MILQKFIFLTFYRLHLSILDTKEEYNPPGPDTDTAKKVLPNPPCPRSLIARYLFANKSLEPQVTQKL